MNDLQVFGFEGKSVRVVEKNGDAWWVLKDVCGVLGLESSHKVADRIDDDERSQIPVIDSMGRSQETTIINESGLYSVILRSDKPEARRFKKWITSEVIPAIRKTGGYLSPAVDFSDPDKVQVLLDNWKRDRAALQIAAPKAEVYDAFLDSTGLYTIKEAAEMMNVPEFGGKELFRLLRLEEIFTRTNKPCVQYQRDGYFVLKASAGGSGSRAMVTPRGIEFIRDLVRDSRLLLCARREAKLCDDDGFIVGIRGAGVEREIPFRRYAQIIHQGRVIIAR